MTAVLPEAGPLGLAGLTDDDLAALFVGGDDAVQSAILAECERQDRAAGRRRKAQAKRAAAEREWLDAAHAHYRAAERECAGNLTVRDSTVGEPFPGLYRLSARDFERQASEEMRNFCEHSPRPTRAEYMRNAFRPRRGAYPWHEPGWKETIVDTQTPAPAPGPGDGAERAARRKARAREYADIRARIGAPPVPARPPGEVAVRTSGTVTARAPGIAPRRPEVDGARLLEQAGLFLLDYASFPGPAAAVACTLWAAHAVARDADRNLIWRASPRLLLTSAENGSGKSTVLDLLAILCRSRAGRLGTVTAPGLVQLLGQLREPAFPDEVQSTFGNGRRAEEVRRIINAGYTRRAAALTGRGAKASLTNVFGPVAMAGLDSLITDTNGRLADTLSRCIIIRMCRPARRMPELHERGEDRGDAIAAALAGWTASVQGELRLAAQNLADAAAEDADGLDGIGDGGRVAQIWRPLFAVADTAGGMWPTAAREACFELAAAAGDLDTVADTMDWLETETAGRSFFDAAAAG